MFNTLNELKGSLSIEELLKYSNELVGKSSEEIKAVLKTHDIEVSDMAAGECFEYLNAVKTMSDEELENVTGGGCESTYSSDTFKSLGLSPSRHYEQLETYHPLITTWMNSCRLLEGGSYCITCTWMCSPSGTPVSYCKARSAEHDLGR